ncbi:hypothetical protein C4577_02880 [Candidatus Parcubacteria bacterium]|nr:MAG: hypothetical protein C4577_02880 [Candidatus Parcubacteria bacterium]
MSTHSAIVEKLPDGKYRGIYCHFDGYLEGVGKTLSVHYLDPKKVSELIDLGALSSLKERVSPLGEHSYEKPEKGTTVAFYRDRVEEGYVVNTGDSLEQVLENIGCYEHVYLFENGKWYYVVELSTRNYKIPLEEALTKEK